MADLLNPKVEIKITSIVIKKETKISGTMADGSEISSTTPSQLEIAVTDINNALLSELNIIAGIE